MVNAFNAGDGTAVLTWNALYSPNLPTSSGWYHIYKEYPAGTWTLIDSTQLLTYTDSIKLCSAFISYYVSIDDNLPCTSVSSIDGKTFNNIIAPETPVIDSVSVNTTTGYSTIGWAASSASDTHGYIIYENINGKCIPIDTVYGAGVTNYVNTHTLFGNTDSASLSYYIAAFDSCKNTSPISDYQKTIFLKSNYDICDRNITLNWTSYVNMYHGLKGYKIFMRFNNGPATLLATNSSSNLSYTQSSLMPNVSYIYFIQAFDSTGTITSTSNTDTIITRAISKPQFVYLKHVSVISNSYVEVKAIVDTSGYISNCKILRADTIIGPFTQVGISTPALLSNIITYNDFSANVNQRSYYYKVVIVDSCGNDIDTSNIGRTIYASALPSSDMTNYLSWNEYETWLGSVQSFNVYRRYDDTPNTLLTTLPAGSTSYTDDVSSLTSSDGKFIYLIEALEGLGNPNLCSDSSISNEAVVVQPPRFYVPNAFVPRGVNNIFIPVNVFVNTSDYQFTIFNRWGIQVFQTNNTSEGWDGNYNGTKASEGVYVYFIKYKNSEGKYIEKQGTVTLLR